MKYYQLVKISAFPASDCVTSWQDTGERRQHERQAASAFALLLYPSDAATSYRPVSVAFRKHSMSTSPTLKLY